jgi:hypothetical protein
MPHTENMRKPSRYPRGGSFGTILQWHLYENGTRPDGQPDQTGKRWGPPPTEFSGKLPVPRGKGGREDRAVNYWLKDEHFPRSSNGIEQVLFNDNPAYEEWRLDLRAAHIEGSRKHVRNASRRLVLSAPLLIIRADTPGDTWPLFAKLRTTTNHLQMYELIKRFGRSYNTSDSFDIALQLLPVEERERIAKLTCSVIEEHWRDIEVTSAASAIAARLGAYLHQSTELRRLNDRIEENIGGAELTMVSVMEPLCFVGMINGRDGPFELNTRRMITDKFWRQNDYEEQLRYYGGLEAHAKNIRKHLQDRAEGHHQHDVGRVISVYSDLIQRPEHVDMAMLLKQKMLASLKRVGMEVSLIGRVEDLMERL